MLYERELLQINRCKKSNYFKKTSQESQIYFRETEMRMLYRFKSKKANPN